MNTNTFDRVVRVVLGVLLLATAIFGMQGVLAWVVGIVGGIVLITGLTGVCLIYKMFGISTRKSAADTQ